MFFCITEHHESLEKRVEVLENKKIVEELAMGCLDDELELKKYCSSFLDIVIPDDDSNIFKAVLNSIDLDVLRCELIEWLRDCDCDEEDYCEEHEQPMMKNGLKCGGCLENEYHQKKSELITEMTEVKQTIHLQHVMDKLKNHFLPETTFVKGIVCKACKNELPEMTMKEHLDGRGCPCQDKCEACGVPESDECKSDCAYQAKRRAEEDERFKMPDEYTQKKIDEGKLRRLPEGYYITTHPSEWKDGEDKTKALAELASTGKFPCPDCEFCKNPKNWEQTKYIKSITFMNKDVCLECYEKEDEKLCMKCNTKHEGNWCPCQDKCN